MRYTSALVLSTLAAGQAAAANVRHANFHARRSAEKPVEWSKVAYDLSNVDWSKVNWSSVFNTPAATPAPTPEPKVKVEQPKTTPAQTPTPTPTPVTKPSSTAAEKPKETPAEKPKETTNDITKGVEEFMKKLGIKIGGVSTQSTNANIRVSDSTSKWSAEFSNSGSQDVKVFCWEANGFSGMSLNVNPPALAINLAPGAAQNVSFAENVPVACAPAYESTKLALFGGIENTWWEATFGPTGAFDVSRNVWMQGSNIHSEGSKCVSDMKTCVFRCQDESRQSCTTGYTLDNCGASNGGGGGYDPVMQGVGGGCAMNSQGEFVRVSFS